MHPNFTRVGRTDHTASNRQSNHRSYAINKRYTVARRQKSRTHESITHSNTACHAYINPNFRPDADSLFNSNANRHTFTNPVADFFANSNANRHTFTNPDFSPDGDTLTDSNADRHTFTNPDFSPDGDTLINPNADRHAFTNPDINSLKDPDPDSGNIGDANSDTRRSSNCQ